MSDQLQLLTPDAGRSARSLPEAVGPCVLWTGCLNHKGYGWDGPARATAHRAAYERANGPVPAGLELDHLCNIRACVNPAHLEPVTHAENTRRAAERRTHCKNGHEWTPENTYRRSTGCRACRACGRDRNERYRKAVAA